MILAQVFSVMCNHIRTRFCEESPVCVYPNFVRRDNSDVWTSISLNAGDFIYLGGKHAFERALIEGYTCQLVGSPNSWNKAVDGWNLEAFNSGDDDKRGNWQLRLSLAFMKYKIIQFDLCVGNELVTVPSTNLMFDQWAWETFPERLVCFIYLWSNHKSLIHPCGSDCSRCVIIDGHQKCRRRICRVKHVTVRTEEFHALKIGCCRTPARGSHYCELHQAEHSPADVPSSSIEPQQRSLPWIRDRRSGRKNGDRGLGAANCRTRKSKSEFYVDRYKRSFGVIAGVTNCKIVITFSELFRSETIREVISLLCSTIRGA